MAKGDHIKVWRCGGLYSHHGIDMGDGTVIHFCGEPLRARDAMVCRTDLHEFLAGGVPILVHHPTSRRSADAVAAAAEEQLHRAEYCVWRNNCEHFATFCKTGKRQSRQVIRVIGVAGLMATAASTAAFALLSVRRRQIT